MSTNVSQSFSIPLRSPEQTCTLARALAPLLVPGDTVLLSGEIGAGKTLFARALIQSRLSILEDVPSPSFTLIQIYELSDAEIWHVDLYRLSHSDEVIDLGLDEALQDAICLIEWPDRLGELAPQNSLKLHFTVTGAQTRTLNISLPPTAQKFDAVFRPQSR